LVQPAAPHERPTTDRRQPPAASSPFCRRGGGFCWLAGLFPWRRLIICGGGISTTDAAAVPTTTTSQPSNNDEQQRAADRSSTAVSTTTMFKAGIVALLSLASGILASLRSNGAASWLLVFAATVKSYPPSCDKLQYYGEVADDYDLTQRHKNVAVTRKPAAAATKTKTTTTMGEVDASMAWLQPRADDGGAPSDLLAPTTREGGWRLVETG